MSRNNHIAEARIAFGFLKTTDSPKTWVDAIDRELKKAGVGYETLDLAGVKTAAQIQNEIKKLIARANIRGAQSSFDCLKQTDSPDIFIDAITSKLQQASAGYEALDPAGLKTAAQMQAEIFNLRAAANIKGARNSFDCLKRVDSPDAFVDAINRQLRKASAGYEVLDPTGSKTAGQMQVEILDMCTAAYIRGARNSFDCLKQTDSPDIFVYSIKQDLKKAFAGYEQLDPRGLKTAGQMQAEITALTVLANIRGAQSSFENFKKYSSQDIFADAVEQKLKAAGADYDVLDPTGKKSADQIKAEIIAKSPACRLAKALHASKTTAKPLLSSAPTKASRVSISVNQAAGKRAAKATDGLAIERLKQKIIRKGRAAAAAQARS